MLLTRIITAVVYGAALTAALLFAPPSVAALVFGVLWLVGAWEWAGFAKLSPTGHVAYVAFLTGLVLASFLWWGERLVVGLAVVAFVWWVYALTIVATYPRRFTEAFVALAGVLVLWPSWLLLVRILDGNGQGGELAFTLVVIVWAADVGAFFAGRWLGRTKLAPAVSPGKTLEGVAGGLVAAGVAAAGAASVLGQPHVAFVGLGVVVALVSVLGDLAQSVFKRNAGLKDSGKLLPGHGGVLDRIDSLTAAIPVFAAGLYALGIVDGL